MASIVLYAAAYRGDVYPFAALGNELSRRGHRVTFVTPKEFHTDFANELFACADHGTDFSPVRLNQPDVTDYVRKWGMRASGVFLLRLYFGKLVVPYLDHIYESLLSTVEVVDADVLVSHPAAAALGHIVAEKIDRPWISGDLFPMLRPTATRPPPGVPDMGERVNTLMWKWGRNPIFAPLTYERSFHDFREKVGLERGGESLVDMMMSPHLNLGMASPHYVPPAPDWPANYHQVGFSFWDGPAGGELADDVGQFLEAGSPPVVVALGTSAATVNPELFTEALDQLDRHGQRALLLTSTDALASSLAKRVESGGHGAWSFVPLRALLPHAQAVVQSGAHGTNAMALAAGLPSVIVPSLFDQVWHGERQEQLGTGILARKPKEFPGAIERLLTDSTLAETAAAFGDLMADEDGPAAASDLVERFLRGDLG